MKGIYLLYLVIFLIFLIWLVAGGWNIFIILLFVILMGGVP